MITAKIQKSNREFYHLFSFTSKVIWIEVVDINNAVQF